MGRTLFALRSRTGPYNSLAAFALMGMLAAPAWAEAIDPSRPAPTPEDPRQGETTPIPERARSADPALPGAGEFDAELIRRARGEWVIVSLAPSAGASRAGLDPRIPAPSPSDQRGIEASVRAYEEALEGRDLEQLARVWVMNPTEREELRRFFARAGSVRVSIDPTHLVVDGNRAVLRFAQRFAASVRPRLGRTFRSFERALAARDAYATWSLDRLSRPN